MTTERRRRNGVAEQRLDAIKKSAAKWFYQRGYEGTDLRLIGNDLNMHAGSLYNYIRSKEELLFLIMQDGMNDIIAGLTRSLDGITDPIQRLDAAAHFHLLHQLSRRYTAWTNHVEVRSLTGDYRVQIMQLRDDYQAKWVTMIQNGVDIGVFLPLDARITAYGFLTMAQGISRWFNPDGPKSAEEVADHLSYMFMRGVCRDPDAIAFPVPRPRVATLNGAAESPDVAATRPGDAGAEA